VTHGNSQSFAYDTLNRLMNATGAYGNFGWTYDLVGNPLTQTLSGASTAYAYTAGTNQLASITAGGTTTPVSYTATGNISSIPPTTGAPAATLNYNAANRMASVIPESGVKIAFLNLDGFQSVNLAQDVISQIL